MGIKGFKVDFMDRDDQTAIEMVERLAACTAKHHLILDLHGIYKPHGLNRTYPNILNYESVFGMEECRWTEAKNDMPLYDVTFPYIRMMAGQVDFHTGSDEKRNPRQLEGNLHQTDFDGYPMPPGCLLHRTGQSVYNARRHSNQL